MVLRRAYWASAPSWPVKGFQAQWEHAAPVSCPPLACPACVTAVAPETQLAPLCVWLLPPCELAQRGHALPCLWLQRDFKDAEVARYERTGALTC